MNLYTNNRHFNKINRIFLIFLVSEDSASRRTEPDQFNSQSESDSDSETELALPRRNDRKSSRYDIQEKYRQNYRNDKYVPLDRQNNTRDEYDGQNDGNEKPRIQYDALSPNNDKPSDDNELVQEKLISNRIGTNSSKDNMTKETTQEGKTVYGSDEVYSGPNVSKYIFKHSSEIQKREGFDRISEEGFQKLLSQTSRQMNNNYLFERKMDGTMFGFNIHSASKIVEAHNSNMFHKLNENIVSNIKEFHGSRVDTNLEEIDEKNKDTDDKLEICDGIGGNITNEKEIDGMKRNYADMDKHGKSNRKGMDYPGNIRDSFNRVYCKNFKLDGKYFEAIRHKMDSNEEPYKPTMRDRMNREACDNNKRDMSEVKGFAPTMGQAIIAGNVTGRKKRSRAAFSHAQVIWKVSFIFNMDCQYLALLY